MVLKTLTAPESRVGVEHQHTPGVMSAVLLNAHKLVSVLNQGLQAPDRLCTQ